MLPDSFAETGFFAHRQAGRVPARFQVVGERSSGTNYVRALLGMNTAMTHCDVLGWKHGFCQPLAIPSDMLVVCVVRHPEPWALSMFNKPWHTEPALQRLPFSEFLRSQWRTIYDRERYFGNLGEAYLGQPLVQDRDPLSGEPFANIGRLRTAKLRHLLSFPARGAACALLRLEQAQARPKQVVTQLCRAFGLPERTEKFRRVTRRKGSRFKPAVAERPPAPEQMSAPDRAFLWSQLDPALETALGYPPPAG